jgi:hypothetical protein
MDSQNVPLPMSGVTNSGEILGESHGFFFSSVLESFG